MNYQKISFDSSNTRLIGNLFSSKSLESPGILLIHGGGEATKERLLPLQEYLFQQNINSFDFDMRGVGESGGKFEDGSLNMRFEDAKAALNFLVKNNYFNEDKISIGGSSLGGHITVKLASEYKGIQSLLLYCPAAYSKEAEDRKLNEEFAKVIRVSGSWKRSPAFEYVKNFKGKILVIYGQEDEVIPGEVKRMYKKSLKKSDEFIVLRRIGHSLLNPSSTVEKKAFENLMNKTSKFLQVC